MLAPVSFHYHHRFSLLFSPVFISSFLCQCVPSSQSISPKPPPRSISRRWPLIIKWCRQTWTSWVVREKSGKWISSGTVRGEFILKKKKKRGALGYWKNLISDGKRIINKQTSYWPFNGVVRIAIRSFVVLCIFVQLIEENIQVWKC